MDATRISIARVVKLGLAVTWQQAGAVLVEAIALARWHGASDQAPARSDECLVTRGGAVVLVGDTAHAAPESLVSVLGELLTVCAEPDRLGLAQSSGHAFTFLTELGERTTPQRRRIDIASLALRALAAEADRERKANPDGVPPPPAHVVSRKRTFPPRYDRHADDRPAATPPHEIQPHDISPRELRPREVRAREMRPVEGRSHPQRPRDMAATERRYVADEPSPMVDVAIQPAAHRASDPPPSQLRSGGTMPSESPRGDAQPRPAARPWPPADAVIPEAVPEPTTRAVPITTPSGIGRARPAPRAIEAADDIPLAFWPRSDPARAPWWRSKPAALIAAASVVLAVVLWLVGALPGRRRPSPAPASASLASSMTPLGALAAPPPTPPEQRPREPAVVETPTPAAAATAPAVRAPIAPPVVPAAKARPAAAAATAAPPVPTMPAGAPPPVVDDAIFSSASRDVVAPVLRSPAPSNTAVLGPADEPAGPYLEVLVNREGSVQDVRVRGRAPGSPADRHDAVAAAARRWQFDPAQLNGQAVRYTIRVVLTR